MTESQKITVKLAELRRELIELSKEENLTPELREKIEAKRTEASDLELRRIAALEGGGNSEPIDEPKGENTDTEIRERIELRKKSRITNILAGVSSGRVVGVEREYQEAVGCGEREIPFDIFEVEQRENAEERAATGAPSTQGIMLRPVVPAVFAGSAAGMLRVNMPNVGSGTPSWPRLTTNLTAGWQAAGGAQAATAAAFTSVSSAPHRLSAKLEIAAETLATVGLDSFEASLRTNMQMVFSNALDSALIAGSGASNQPEGLLAALGSVTAESTTETWVTLNTKFSNLIDGIFAKDYSDISVLFGVDSMKTLAQLFPATTAGLAPRLSAKKHLSDMLNMIRTTAHMPAVASSVQDAIAVFGGYAGEVAVCPTWGAFSIDDPYSQASSATKAYNMHALIGDVRVLQPSAYSRVSLKLT